MKCRSLFWLAVPGVLAAAVLMAACPGLLASPVTYHGVTFPLGDLAFADRVVQYIPASCVRAAYANPEMALGPPDALCGGCRGCGGCHTNAVALGFRLSEIDERGILVLEFADNVLMDGPGDDLFLFITNDRAARVEISKDGQSFIFVGEVAGCPAGIDIGPFVNPTDEFRFVRISDVPGDEDRSTCSGPSIDAVGAMGQARVRAPEPEPGLTVTGEAFGSLSLMPVGELAFTFEATDRNVFVLLDRSSSMRWRVGDEVKMDMAKSVLLELLDSLPAGGIVSVRTFGGMCETELVAPATVADSAALREAMLGIQPSGFTPIDLALTATQQDLESVEGRHLILLISDGEETCAGDPVRAAERLVELGYDLMIHVIGFDVGGREGLAAREQLIQIAEASGGIYFGADSIDELRQALGLVEGVGIPYTVYDETGAEVYRGMLGDPGRELAAGTYTIVIDTPAEQIVLSNVIVRAQQETTVRLGRSDGAYEADVGG